MSGGSFPLYHYRGKCIYVVDGDTCDLFIDLGCFAYEKRRCRLLGIDTPELHDPDESVRVAALRAKSTLIDELGTKDLYIKTNLDKDDKYGRLLVTIYTAEDAEKSLNRQMVEWGLATPYIDFERV